MILKPYFYFLFLAAWIAPGWSLTTATADDGEITWLVEFDGKTLPSGKWTAVGNPKATVESGGLRLIDDSPEFAHYRAPWCAQPDQEIVVEVKLKVVSVDRSPKHRATSLFWPWRDGAPVSVLVSDGERQEGLVLFVRQATSHTDRFIPMDTRGRYHTYRLIIRDNDMEMWGNGEKKVVGQGAFWKPADSPEPFIQFGSTAGVGMGEAIWSSVRLGIRKPTKSVAKDPITITVSKPWDIPREFRQTRPYLYDLGKDLLLMSVAQGPDAFYEPYGLLRSTDVGKTWKPIPGLDQSDKTPLPVLRRPDGSILAMSRWTRTRPDGAVVGHTTRLNADATMFKMEESLINLPREYTNESPGDQIICERHVWNEGDGAITMVVRSRKQVERDDGRKITMRLSHLVRSVDEGRTWNYVSTIGPGGEPAVVRLTDSEMTAVIRGAGNSRMIQTFSHDAGNTWSAPVELEVGRVLPDLVMMSNGVVACSYGRPASCLMFSLDHGKNWTSHHVISDKVGFNYTSIREISPGRLLYVHDAPNLNAVYVDVEVKLEP